MMSFEKDSRIRACARPLAWFGLSLLLVVGLVFDVRAAVNLISFTATPQSDGSILVTWETASELDTIAFNLYRSDSASGHGDQPMEQQAARGDAVTGARYKYKDVATTPGVRYYYYLEEVAQSGAGQKFGPVNAGVGLSTEPTATATATRTATATSGAPPGSTATVTVSPTVAPGRTATATQTSPGEQPTATRAYTNTPQPNAAATATGVPAIVPPGAPSATPAPPAPGAVTTPTGGPLAAVTAPVGSNPTPLPTSPQAAAAPSPSPQPATPGAPAETTEPTPRATQAPRIFESAATVLPAGETPQRPSSQAAAPAADGAERNTRLVLFLGGGAIGLAVLLGAAAVLIWRARSR